MTTTVAPQVAPPLPEVEGPGTPIPPVLTEDEEKKKRRRKAFILFFLFFALLSLIALFIWYLLFRQPINPIPVIPASQIPNYATSFYGVTRPLGVAVSPSGDRIYVTEGGPAFSAVVLDAGGRKIADMAMPDDGFNHDPLYVAVDPITSEVYVSDRLAGAIYVYGRDGGFLRTAKLAAPLPGWQPIGLAFDAAGNLFVTDASRGLIRVFDRDLREVRVLGEKDGLNFPNGLAVDKDGRIYLADSNNGRLLVYGTDGSIIARIGRGSAKGNLGLPRDVAIDGQGRVFIADSTGHGVQVYALPTADSFTFHGGFGVEGTGDGMFEFPNAVATDDHGYVYVADSFNDRIQVWKY